MTNDRRFEVLIEGLNAAAKRAEKAAEQLEEANEKSMSVDDINRLYTAVKKLEEHGWPDLGTDDS